MQVELPAGGWTPRAHQRPLWGYLERGGRRAYEVAHRRWGKDEVALNWSAVALHQRVCNVWHCLPEFAQARKAIWTSVNPHTGRRRIDEAFPLELRASTNEQEMFIRFKIGSTWQVIGSDNYDRLVGASVGGVVFSEWALANPAAWAYIAPILAENNGWAVFITTPRGRNHAKTMLDATRQSPDWFSEVSAVEDTGAVSAEVIEQQRTEYHGIFGQDAGDALIEQEYSCSFEAAILGAYWGREIINAEKEGRIAQVDYEPKLPLQTAWDLGVGDDTSIWLFQEHFQQIRVVDYYENRGYAVDHYVEWLNSRPYLEGVQSPWGDDLLPHDARVREWTASGPDGKAKSRVQTMIELKRKPVVISNQRLEDTINAGRRILPYAVFDKTRCAKGLESLRQYRRTWDDKLKVFSDAPLHDWASHGASAWRTLSMGVKNIRPVVVKPEGAKPKGVADMTFDQLMKAQRPKRERL